MEKPANRPVIHIGNNVDRASSSEALKVISARLQEAIVLGRTEIGIELAKQLNEFGGVKNVTLADVHVETK